MNLHDPDYDAGHSPPKSTAEIFAELVALRHSWQPAEHIQADVDPEPHGFLTVICGAVAVVLLAMAFFNIPLWSN